MTDTLSAVRRPPGPAGRVHLGIDPETLDTLVRARDEYGDIVAMVRRNGRLLMPFDWEGHPLRKDYPLGYEEVQFTFNYDEIDQRKPRPKE